MRERLAGALALRQAVGRRAEAPAERLGPEAVRSLYGTLRWAAGVEKFNPWHTAQGRFTAPDQALAAGKAAWPKQGYDSLHTPERPSGHLDVNPCQIWYPRLDSNQQPSD